MNKVAKILVAAVFSVGALCVGLFFAGCQSPEAKANKLIKEELFKVLYDFQSYEPIETIVDSAFTSIYENEHVLTMIDSIFHYLELAEKGYEEMIEFIEWAEKAKVSADVFAEYRDSFSRQMYSEFMGNYNERMERAEEWKLFADESKDKYLKFADTVQNETANFKKDFIGWQAVHKFRCRTRGGQFDIGNYLFIFDKDFKTIIRYDDTDDDEYITVRENINYIISNDFSN